MHIVSPVKGTGDKKDSNEYNGDPRTIDIRICNNITFFLRLPNILIILTPDRRFWHVKKLSYICTVNDRDTDILSDDKRSLHIF